MNQTQLQLTFDEQTETTKVIETKLEITCTTFSFIENKGFYQEHRPSVGLQKHTLIKLKVVDQMLVRGGKGLNMMRCVLQTAAISELNIKTF